MSQSNGDTHPAATKQYTPRLIFWEVTKGRRPMPAFADKLSDQERWQVVDFIRTFAAPAGNGASSQP